MAGIALVAGEVDRAVDVDRQVGVDLDQAAEPALIPVVAAPRLVGHVLDGELFVGRQLHVRERSLAARLNGGLEHRVELVRRESRTAAGTPRSAIPAARLRESASRGVSRICWKCDSGIGRRDRVVERLRFLVERQALALQHAHPRGQRRQLALRGIDGAAPPFRRRRRRCARNAVSSAAARAAIASSRGLAAAASAFHAGGP